MLEWMLSPKQSLNPILKHDWLTGMLYCNQPGCISRIMSYLSLDNHGKQSHTEPCDEWESGLQHFQMPFNHLLVISSCCLSTILFKSRKCQKYEYLVWQYDTDINSSVAECESVHIYGLNTYTLTHSGVKWEFTARKYVIIANDGDQSSTKWKLQTGMNQGQCY